MAASGSWRAYGKYSWMILFVSALVGIFGGVSLMFPSDSTSLSPRDLWILRAWGITWVGFNILALVMTLIPYRRYERWAWYTLWILPLLWLSHFALSPDLPYLIVALLTTVGLVLPYRRFFSGAEEGSSWVR